MRLDVEMVLHHSSSNGLTFNTFRKVVAIGDNSLSFILLSEVFKK